jgi:hypothetical protein
MPTHYNPWSWIPSSWSPTPEQAPDPFEVRQPEPVEPVAPPVATIAPALEDAPGLGASVPEPDAFLEAMRAAQPERQVDPLTGVPMAIPQEVPPPEPQPSAPPPDLGLPHVGVGADPAPEREERAALEQQQRDEFEQAMIGQMTGPELAAYHVGQERDREQMGNERMRAAIAADALAQEQQLEDYRAAQAETRTRMEQIDADLQELGQREIDTGRWWRSRSTGQQAAAFLSAAAAGILNPRGPNGAVQQMLGAQQQDIDAQVADIQNRRGVLSDQRGLVADMMRQGRDLFEAETMARLASFESTKMQIANEMALYAPGSTTAVQMQMAYREASALEAQARAQAEQQMLENSLKLHKDAREERALRETERMGAHRRGMDRRAELRAEQPEPGADFTPSPTGLRNPDGTPFSTGHQATDAKLADQVAAYHAVDDAMAQLEAHIDRHGDAQGVINWGRLNTTEREQTRALQANLTRALLSAQSSGTLSDRSVKALEAIAGGDLSKKGRANPTEVLRTQRRAAHQTLEAGLRGREFRGEVPRGAPLERDEMVTEAREAHEPVSATEMRQRAQDTKLPAQERATYVVQAVQSLRAQDLDDPAEASRLVAAAESMPADQRRIPVSAISPEAAAAMRGSGVPEAAGAIDVLELARIYQMEVEAKQGVRPTWGQAQERLRERTDAGPEPTAPRLGPGGLR